MMGAQRGGLKVVLSLQGAYFAKIAKKLAA